MKKITFRVLLTSLFILTFLATNAQSQNFRMTPLEEGSNYFEILKRERARLLPLRGLIDRRSKKQIKQFERWAAFWKDRILPDGSFVSTSFVKAEMNKDRQIQTRRRSQVQQNSLNDVNQWTLVGPATLPKSNVGYYPGMGRLNTVAFNGTDVNTMYVGSPTGGVWKTSDAGASWLPIGDNLPNMGVSHIALDPTDINTIYVASGDYDGLQTKSTGVYKSIDGGASWSITGLSYTIDQDIAIAKLLIDPNNPNTIFATTNNAIKQSADGGATWTDVMFEEYAYFNDISYQKGSNTTLYATSRAGKFYVSTNNGTSWTVASTPSPVNRIDLALTEKDPNQILILDEEGNIKKSTNQGSTWTTVSRIADFDSQGSYNMTIAVSPLDKNLVLVGGIDGWRSKNGGISWEKYLDGYWEDDLPYFYVHSDHHDMLFIPNSNIAFSVNDGGIFKGDASQDNAWTDLSSGLAITQYYMVAGTPQNANLLIAGAQDNDIARYDGTDFIGENDGSDGVEGLWDYSNSDIAWTCSQNGILYRTLDGFETSEGLEAPEGAPFVWQLDIHPTIPTTIFGGFEDLYKSTDRGENWTNLFSGAGGEFGGIDFFAISRSNPDVMYVSGAEYVKLTQNGGNTWSTVNLPQVGTLKSIEIHPTNPTEIYLAYAGYEGGRVFKSTDAGVNWTDISGSLPNIPAHKVIYKTGSSDGELFLATDMGVYYRTNSTGDWVKLDAGLPNVIVHDLEIHYGTNVLRAATFGRGIWEKSLAGSIVSREEVLLPETSINVYPNPAVDNIFTLSLENLQGSTNIIIYNIIGSVIKEIRTVNSTERINLQDYAKGLYMIKITNGNRSIIKKVILN